MRRPIIYVEDEESDALLLKISFERIGVVDAFKLVPDGEQAIAYLAGKGNYANRELFPLPCLVLLDLNLPRKSGFEVLQWRRQDKVARTIPFIVFTSSSQPRDIQQAYDLGANAYLTKVPSLNDWTKRASAIRDFWLEQNTSPVCM